jgi:hypothetical protein
LSSISIVATAGSSGAIRTGRFSSAVGASPAPWTRTG